MDANKQPVRAASLGTADRIGADDLSAALARGVLRAIEEQGPSKINRRIWVGIWVDYGPLGPQTGPIGQDVGGGLRG